MRSSRLSELLHLVGSHSPGQGYSRSGSPPVAASCHSHSVGKRTFDPVRLLSHLENATASNQETVARGELASFQLGSSGFFALLHIFPPLGISVAILGVYERLELRVSDRIFCNPKSLYIETFLYAFKRDFAPFNIHPVDIRKAVL